MTRTKKYLIIFGILLVLILGLSWMLPKVYKTDTHINIDAPAIFVYNAINDLNYQKDWNGKSALDTSFLLVCAGSTVGAKSSCDYKTKQYGNGVLRIMYSGADSLVIADEPDNASARSFQYKVIATDSLHTKLQVVGLGQSGFITNIWNFIHKWKLSKHIKHGLDNLKIFVENRHKNKIYNGFKIEESLQNEKNYIMHRSEVEMENLAQYYAQNISALYQTALENNIAVSGMPCGLYFKWDTANNKADMAAALPTVAETNVINTSSFHIPQRLALKVAYKGESSKSGIAHMAIDAYMLDHRLTQDVPVVEEYMTNPSEEPDPSKWITNIYYYVNRK